MTGGKFEGKLDLNKAAGGGKLKLRFTELMSGLTWETEITP